MKKNGFTLIELLVTMVVLAIVTAITIPLFARWLPDYRLRAAARDLYSNMHLAMMGAMRNNSDWAIVFDTGANRYLVCSDRGSDNSWSGTADNAVEKTVLLADYESGVKYGHGVATKDATIDEDPLPADNVSYNYNVAVFNSRGTGSGGYVYLENDEGTITYAVGTRSTGIILLRKWSSSSSEWE
jgi:prepilin-type N-terminal cleavage/methylation domain-containing protein